MEWLLALCIPLYIREQCDFVSLVCKQLESWAALCYVSATRTIIWSLDAPRCIWRWASPCSKCWMHPHEGPCCGVLLLCFKLCEGAAEDSQVGFVLFSKYWKSNRMLKATKWHFVGNMKWEGTRERDKEREIKERIKEKDVCFRIPTCNPSPFSTCATNPTISLLFRS